MPAGPVRIWCLVVLLASAQLACGGVYGTPPPGVSGELAAIDAAMAQAVVGSLVFDAPTSMALSETEEVRLLVSASMTEAELSALLEQDGRVVAGSLEVTPRMRAELIGQSPEAFEIRALHLEAEQLLGMESPAEWRWLVTPLKAGEQALLLTVARLVQFEGDDYWSAIESYRQPIEVTVTTAQRLAQIDWEWVVGIGLTGILIPALWRLIDRRSRGPAAKK